MKLGLVLATMIAAVLLTGCIQTSLPPKAITTATVRSAPPAGNRTQQLMSLTVTASHAPPPFKLVELPASTDTTGSAAAGEPGAASLRESSTKPTSLAPVRMTRGGIDTTGGASTGELSAALRRELSTKSTSLDPSGMTRGQSSPAPAATTEFWQARGELGQYGGTLTVSTFGSGPKTFNYWASDDAESGGIGLLLNEPLVDMDPWKGEFYPRLAKSFTISPDKKTYTFVLRKGLQWSDGQPVTADDVIFTFNTLLRKGFANPSLRDPLSVGGIMPDVEKVDDLTVKFTTRRPLAPFLEGLRSVPVAPQHALAETVKKSRTEFTRVWDINDDPHKIVGCGPFMVDRYLPGQRVELVRNPHYAMVDKSHRRLPYLSRFNLAIVPDQNTELLKFYANEMDFLDVKAVRGVDAALMKQRERSGNCDFKMYNLGADDGTVFLMFNMNRRKNPKTGKFYVDPIKQKWFNNVYFRQAVSHAIDRRRIVDNILRGVGLPLYSPETPSSLFYDKDLVEYPQDLNLAAELLKKGGFHLDSNGQLLDSDNHRVEFTLQTNAGNSTREGCCVMIVDVLKQLGMKVNFQPIDFNVMIDKTAQSCDWESIFMALTGDRFEPYSGANIWKSNGRLHMFDQRLPDPDGTTHVHDARDWELEIDKAFEDGATTFDTAKRHECFNRYQKILYDRVPFIYVYTVLDLSAMKNRIGNYNPTPIGIYYLPKGTLHNIEEIYVKQGRH